MANEDRFTGRVAEYDKYRLRYPESVVDELRERCGLRATDLVADVGAGTGMLAELLLEAGNRVLAVEPNAEMREVCEGLALRYAKLRVVNATAEATSLEDASIDLVTVGRAFHWFDRDRALAEFKRILKPGGWVVLVANRRDRESDALTKAYEAILREHGTDHSHTRGELKSLAVLKPYGEDVASFHFKIPRDQMLTLEEFLGQTQSLSVAPLPGETKYADMQRALRDLFTTSSENGTIKLGTALEMVGWRTPSAPR